MWQVLDGIIAINIPEPSVIAPDILKRVSAGKEHASRV
jgi:hypothetical protein